jgi:ABC-2 type transport system permease protein
MPMLFLSGALFPLNGLPTWLAFITRLNPLTYAIAPFRQVIFNAQHMSELAQAHFSTSVTWFGWPLPMWLELLIVVIFAAIFFVLAVLGLSQTE